MKKAKSELSDHRGMCKIGGQLQIRGATSRPPPFEGQPMNTEYSVFIGKTNRARLHNHF